MDDGVAVGVGGSVGVMVGLTVMAVVVAVMRLNALLVTVIVCEPGVFRVTAKVPVPFMSLLLRSASGRIAAASVEVKMMVAPYPWFPKFVKTWFWESCAVMVMFTV